MVLPPALAQLGPLKAAGRTVFALRRHRHSDVDVAELLRLGTVSELATTVFGGDTIIQVEAEGSGIEPVLERVADVRRVAREASGTFRLFCARDVRAEIAAALVGAGVRLLRLNLLQLSLDAVYTRYFEELRHAA